jgi:hypothetical protein
MSVGNAECVEGAAKHATHKTVIKSFDGRCIMKHGFLHSVLLLVFALAIIIACGGDDSTGPQEEPNLVWVDSVSAAPGDQAVVDVYFRNGSDIMGAEVPLRFSGSGFSIDSGSFVGSRFSSALLAKDSIDEATNTIFLMTATLTSVSKGEGIFARLYVSLDEGATAQEIEIDSAFVNISGNVYHVVSFATSQITQILPPFIAGKIVVEE